MTLILDTNVLIDLDNQDANTVQSMKQLRAQYPLTLKIAFMSYFEFYHGLRNKVPSKLPRSLAFLEVFETLLPTKQTVRLLSQLKHKYPNTTLSDLLIAAQAIECEAILVTADKEFENISELRTVLFSKNLSGINKGMKRRDHRERSV